MQQIIKGLQSLISLKRIQTCGNEEFSFWQMHTSFSTRTLHKDRARQTVLHLNNTSGPFYTPRV